MVRAIAGTLTYVGGGKLAPEQVRDVLLACDREQAGPTLPACGLFMNRLWYDDTPELDGFPPVGLTEFQVLFTFSPIKHATIRRRDLHERTEPKAEYNHPLSALQAGAPSAPARQQGRAYPHDRSGPHALRLGSGAGNSPVPDRQLPYFMPTSPAHARQLYCGRYSLA